jgi:hypothetical protein
MGKNGTLWVMPSVVSRTGSAAFGRCPFHPMTSALNAQIELRRRALQDIALLLRREKILERRDSKQDAPVGLGKAVRAGCIPFKV